MKGEKFYNNLLKEQKKRIKNMKNKKEVSLTNTRFLKNKYSLPEEDITAKNR